MLGNLAKKFLKGGKPSENEWKLDWQERNRALVAAIREGRAEEARDMAEALVAHVEERYTRDAPERATTYNNMGMVLLMEKDFELAEECFREAVAMRRRLFGAQHKEVALIYLNLIELYKHMAREILLATVESVPAEEGQ
ncbi:MAG: tetratricopeptide repeat protein [Thermodesulfobacteriota bacterium]